LTGNYGYSHVLGVKGCTTVAGARTIFTGPQEVRRRAADENDQRRWAGSSLPDLDVGISRRSLLAGAGGRGVAAGLAPPERIFAQSWPL